MKLKTEPDIVTQRRTALRPLKTREILLIAIVSGIASVAVFLLSYAFWGQVIADFFASQGDPWLGCAVVLLGVGIGYAISLASAFVAKRKAETGAVLVASAVAVAVNIVVWTVIAYIYSAPGLAGYSFFEVFGAFPRVWTFLARDVPGGIIFFWIYVQVTHAVLFAVFLKILGVHEKVVVETQIRYERRKLKWRRDVHHKKRQKKIKVRKEKYKRKKIKKVKVKKLKYKKKKVA